MIVQNMTEELAHVHKVVVNSSASNLSNMMSYAGAWLMVCSLLVSFYCVVDPFCASAPMLSQ
ncbi:hypothetical protein QW180_27210 [Vibrio sinaloensis]|nr:hypothetical protein [Vibrio sinaloensis]